LKHASASSPSPNRTPSTETALLLVELGTPDEPTPSAVRRFLREFLTDQLRIDLSPFARWALLNLVILPFRPKKSAAAYRSIWTPEGSPLLLHSRTLNQRVALELQSDMRVHLAMRYGEPSISRALGELKKSGVTEVRVLPLNPQYSLSFTQSIIDRVKEVAAAEWPEVALKFLPTFYDAPDFLDAWAEVVKPALEAGRADHVLFSFHGLPEKHVRLTDRSPPGSAHCLASPSCCERLTDANRLCYRAHSFHIGRELARRVGYADRFSVAFQSRLTKKWIEPFSDQLYESLPKRGVKRLAVACPTFVSDNLETLEEVAIRGRETFQAAGGEELVFVPSLNAHPSFVKVLARLAREAQ
jgi:ferrochelatase